MSEEFETRARRGKMAQIVAAQAEDAARVAQLEQLMQLRATQTVTGLEILQRFNTGGDVNALKDELQQWGQGPGFQAYGGVNGQMFLRDSADW